MTGQANSYGHQQLRQESLAPDRIWLPQAAAIGGFLYFITHGIRIIFGTESKVMEWLYDDAFYYLITAMHFSRQHISSFDGVTRTSGYHPLWMWLCALVYGLRGRLDLTYVRSCMALALSISGIAFLLVLIDACRNRRAGMLWALALTACSYSALNNAASVMEWPLVILCWCILHRLLLPRGDDDDRQIQPAVYLACFFTGAAGSFSRTDFGLIPACYLAAALSLALRYRFRNPALRSAAAVCGAAVGLLLVFVYDHRMTGSWMQGSAQAKHLAATVSAPFNPAPALWQFLRVLFFLPALDLSAAGRARWMQSGLILLLCSLGLLALAAVAARKRLAESIAALFSEQPRNRFAVTASILGIAGYAFLYGFNSQATYGWYSANVTGFILILAACLLGTLRTNVAAVFVLPLMLLNITAAEWCGGNAKQQWLEVVGGKAMHLDHPTAIMGGGDVGKPSFYNGGTMFNLDGLMNNEILSYLAKGDLHCYVLSRQIQFLSNLGTVTMPIVDAERLRQGKRPLPWGLYFKPVPVVATAQSSASYRPYLQTDFAAIRASGECQSE